MAGSQADPSLVVPFLCLLVQSSLLASPSGPHSDTADTLSSCVPFVAIAEVKEGHASASCSLLTVGSTCKVLC